jgi:putative iron-regulated protein
VLGFFHFRAEGPYLFGVITVLSRLLVAMIVAAPLFASAAPQAPTTEQDVVRQYADVAHATYQDALFTALTLQTSVEQLLASPSDDKLRAARLAWKAARVPYQQSEVFRFGNPVVDDWEGQLNAWPLDEGLIDYVDQDSYQAELGNVGAEANIIASTTLQLGSNRLDTAVLSPALLADLNELAGSEANVATGYHAIEFLLWGQDLNGTESGAGQRAYTDFVKGESCSNQHCERRGEYLTAISLLLVNDLEYMEEQWSAKLDDNYRATLLKLNTKQAMTRILFGMGSLALGELAGERLKVALEANSPEDEHDCFSDNTHYSHFYNGLGIRNVYLGQYQRIDGSVVKGASLSQLVAGVDGALDKKLRGNLISTEASLQKLVDSAARTQAPQHFDQLIAEGNTEGEAMITAAIVALVAETETIEVAARALGIDSLSPDNADHQF